MSFQLKSRGGREGGGGECNKQGVGRKFIFKGEGLILRKGTKQGVWCGVLCCVVWCGVVCGVVWCVWMGGWVGVGVGGWLGRWVGTLEVIVKVLEEDIDDDDGEGSFRDEHPK